MTKRLASLILILILLFVAFVLPLAATQETITVPACKPDLKMIVEILADYNVEHQSSIFAGQFWGVTDYRERQIFISDRPDVSIRRETVLHEMGHVCYRNLGIEMPQEIEEALVARQAKELYRELFGGAK